MADFDLAAIKQAARITTDDKGEAMVQIPVQVWQELLEQIEPETSSNEDTASEGSNDLFAMLIQMSEELDIQTGRSDISENFDAVVGDIITEALLTKRDDSQENPSR